MERMERGVCLERALLGENDPLATTLTLTLASILTHVHSTRPEQLRAETRLFEALRVPDYGGMMPDNNVAETARSPPNLACLSAPK